MPTVNTKALTLKDAITIEGALADPTLFATFFPTQLHESLQEFEKTAQQIDAVLAGYAKYAITTNKELLRISKDTLIEDIVRIHTTQHSPYQLTSKEIANTPKAMLPLTKKQILPMSAITVENVGFKLHGKPIYGITISSRAGMLLVVFINPQFPGKISDNKISGVLMISSQDSIARYAAIHELTRILKQNNLKLIMERHRGLKEYVITGIRMYIRKRKSQKKVSKTI